MTDKATIEGTNYHIDFLECDGCHKHFCNTVREEATDDKRYCMGCFNHRNGMELTQQVIKLLDKENNFAYNIMLWEVPAEEIPKEIYDTIPFVGKPQN